MVKDIKNLQQIRYRMAKIKALLDHLCTLRNVTEEQIKNVKKIKKDFINTVGLAISEKRKFYGDIKYFETQEIDIYDIKSGFSYRKHIILSDIEIELNALYKEVTYESDDSTDNLLKTVSSFQCFGISELKDLLKTA